MDDRERGLAFLFAITLPPVMVWFLVAKFTYGIDPSTAKYLIPYLVKNTFSLWPLWSALIAGWFIGVGGLIAFIIYDKRMANKPCQSLPPGLTCATACHGPSVEGLAGSSVQAQA